jgi:hypothetical protein
MKYTAILAILAMSPAALLAAPKNSASVRFTETVTINGTQVPPGDYSVQWQGTGPAVEASILQGKKVLTTAPATLTERKGDSEVAVETNQGENNTKVLEAIDWKNRSLHFDQGNTGSTGTKSSGAAN